MNSWVVVFVVLLTFARILLFPDYSLFVIAIFFQCLVYPVMLSIPLLYGVTPLKYVAIGLIAISVAQFVSWLIYKDSINIETIDNLSYSMFVAYYIIQLIVFMIAALFNLWLRSAK
jgi:hypothetical protein